MEKRLKFHGELRSHGEFRSARGLSHHAAENQCSETNHPAMRLDQGQRKMRNCLRCGSSFESVWVGERICEKCKKSHDWRTGLPNNPDFID